ncbi:MAG: tetratricopeptide repeat protein [Acidobacteriota bacterium]
MLDHLKTLLRIYYQPARAFGETLDTGSLVFASIAAVAVSLALQSLSTLAPVAFLFAPSAVVIIASWVGRGSMGVALQRDYAPMLACVLMAWAAANLPVAPVAWAAPQFLAIARIVGIALFLFLSGFAVRAVAGASAVQSAGTVLGAAAIAIGGYFAWDQLGGIPYMFASPFLLIWLYPLIRSYTQGFGNSLHSRQNFRRNLEASTLNPRDADAHYQLGLIYQERRNYTEAIARFTKAVEIDKSDPSAHYQLGVIARDQRRLDDALGHISQAYSLDPKYSSSEVLRDLGATNLELGNPELALTQLEPYVNRREYDPQGLYWLGRTYKALNRPADARTTFERAIEAAKTAPPHLRRQTAKWNGLSRSELRSLK